ncbi:ATP synthase subunit I [Thermodesulfobacteriota bacterium]
MESIHQIQKKFGSRAMVMAVIAGIIFIMMGQKSVAKGLVLGSIFSVINFILIGEILPLIITASRKRSVLFSFVSMLFRFLLLSTPLILSLKMESLNFVAATIGIFMVQIMIMGDHLLRLVHPEGMQGT